LKKEYNTYKEIMTQVESWGKVYSDIVNEKVGLYLNIFSDDYDEIIFFGCGSSYNLSQSASFFTQSLLNDRNCLALPSSELLINTDIYINKNKKYLFIGFSRSGETTESIYVVNKMKNYKNIKTFIISCRENGSIIKLANNYFVCRDANEKSIVTTKSFSSMLFAYCLMLSKFLKNKEMLMEFKNLISYLSKNISNLYYDINNYLNENSFNSYFVLGNGFNYGLAVEADLKMKEMTQIPSYSYYLHEFNHGPKSLLDDRSLCLILTLDNFEENMTKVIYGFLKLGPMMVIIGNSKIRNEDIYFLLTDSNFNNRFVRSFINIPVFQIFAYISAVNKNLNPDKPKNLSYILKI